MDTSRQELGGKNHGHCAPRPNKIQMRQLFQSCRNVIGSQQRQAIIRICPVERLRDPAADSALFALLDVERQKSAFVFGQMVSEIAFLLALVWKTIPGDRQEGLNADTLHFA